MSASLRFSEKLEQINRFWIEKITKENEEKAKNENEEILKTLGLTKMFQDTLKKNELFNLMNGDFEDSKSIFKSVKKSAEIYNKTFDGLDTGNFKPLALKIFDIAKDELKDKAKDTAKDSFEDFFGAKHDEAKKAGIKDISNNINEIEKDIKEKEDSNSNENIEFENKNSNSSKSKNYERQRLRYR